MLLHVADRQTGDKRVRRAALRDDLASFKIKDDCLDALRAGIDANEKTHVKVGFAPVPQDSDRGASRTCDRGIDPLSNPDSVDSPHHPMPITGLPLASRIRI
jgi:hypothetical protein